MATQTSVSIWRDKQFGAAVLAAPIFWVVFWWWTAPSVDLEWPLRRMLPFLLSALVYPVLEEIVFRGGLQTVLLRQSYLAGRWFGLSRANVVTSILFAAFHLFAHTPQWAAAVVVPSLIFGYFRDRHDSVTGPIALHVFYNAGYFWLFGA